MVCGKDSSFLIRIKCQKHEQPMQPATKFATCPCNLCSQNIEFDSEHAGEPIACPHCGMETTLFVPPSPKNEPPPVLPAFNPGGMEEPIFKYPDVVVTRTRFIVFNQTYPIAGITSVRIGKINQSPAGPVCAILFGLAVILGTVALSSDWNSGSFIGLMGLTFIAGGIIRIRKKPEYLVIVGTAGGDQQAYRSKDHALINLIVNGLNVAIVSRG
jgi:hypothetical protein